MNIVMIVPTGLGCEIGGHAGDAQPVARLIGKCCDNFITHPNVVNASDINEMPENTWYVEGSILDRFLRGHVILEPVNSNKILVAVNKADYQSINAVSAARMSLGINAEIIELDTPLEMIARMENGLATGDVNGWEDLCMQVSKYEFDALAIASPITISEETLVKYFTEGGVNPVGGVEAVASKLIADKINKPVAHGPVDYSMREFREVVDPRKAVEIVTENFIHCILKGLHKAPRLIETSFGKTPVESYVSNKCISYRDIDVMISPYGCWGEPHRICRDKCIPIIIVKENKTVLDVQYPSGNDLIFVDNYIEAAGYIMAMRAGVHPPTVRRPVEYTTVIGHRGI
jgi:hypothetical protein